ncbi:MAG: hypothetical protein U0232_06735 [Thermomicrobiales bacterium]
MAKHRRRKLLALREQHALAQLPPVVGFTARLYVLRRDEGGRTMPIRNGYRVQSRFTTDQPWDNDVVVQLTGQETCAAGDECIAQLWFAVPDAVTVTVVPGATFILREGPNVVVRGTVTEVVHSPVTP